MKIGFIGAGNMGSAILAAIRAHAIVPDENLYISRLHPEKNVEMTKSIHTVSNNKMLAEICDYVILAVKPQQANQVLDEIQKNISGKVLISIMAGWTREMLQQRLPENTRILCVMPNTPLLVGEGMTLISKNTNCSNEEIQFIQNIFEASGKVIQLDQKIFSAANAISGCGPAFAYVFMEALADGAVQFGVPRKVAYELTAQLLIGSGKMLQETGLHPGELKDAVCSPNGTTIAGIHALENGCFRGTVINCIEAVIKRNYELQNNK